MYQQLIRVYVYEADYRLSGDYLNACNMRKRLIIKQGYSLYQLFEDPMGALRIGDNCQGTRKWGRVCLYILQVN